MPKYVALLRGINVGGNKKVPMADLKKMMEKNGFTNVRTVLASGNVVFDADASTAAAVKTMMDEKFEKTFGFTSHTIIRTLSQIGKLMESDPFKGIKVTPDTRLYVTFLSEKPKSKLKIPYVSPDGNYRILKVTDGEVCSVLTLTPASRSVDAMAILEKEFGKNITTRNWNTVEKLLK